MDKSLVIFDLDGTLIDTIGDLSAAVEFALSEGGFPGHSVEEYRAMVGHGIRNLVTRALPEGVSDEVIDLSLSRFLEYYTSHIDILSRPYPGIHELLRELSDSGFKLAVTSNKFQAGTESLIRRFFPDIPFVKILGNAPGLPLKPDPEVVRLAMEAAFAGSPPARGRVHSRVALRLRSGLAAAEYGRCAVAQPETGAEEARSIPATIYPDRARSAGRRNRALPSHNSGGYVVLVGDSATDIRTARNAGIGAIGVSWGFRPKADLSEADVVVDTVDQLREVLLREINNLNID
ncbi:MAG: HAD hydrolase-like protein [Bacteroidales bacterium]|nr:HAD hydrolase-like protein [Bacteroidales bacterium]